MHTMCVRCIRFSSATAAIAKRMACRLALLREANAYSYPLTLCWFVMWEYSGAGCFHAWVEASSYERVPNRLMVAATWKIAKLFIDTVHRVCISKFFPFVTPSTLDALLCTLKSNDSSFMGFQVLVSQKVGQAATW
ncbi:hypothetical protein B0T26DRAFT_721510 [Lasiosphaeria miniovina]|uniref:Uncharacterized protein n=1 Tax=Lasiosphaeria miniovina TaxID=1954250 RepID=A0AA40A4Z7_9PEZI|nr:uncharacterized protein B0T26DRAFT_721510 [Lasiosphaeria miniovina]KAK0709436.1 hypothetical protein B0T26DRAFT_721510 [Lasiosphaeria miniovina]